MSHIFVHGPLGIPCLCKRSSSSSSTSESCSVVVSVSPSLAAETGHRTLYSSFILACTARSCFPATSCWHLPYRVLMGIWRSSKPLFSESVPHLTCQVCPVPRKFRRPLKPFGSTDIVKARLQGTEGLKQLLGQYDTRKLCMPWEVDERIEWWKNVH